MNFSPGLKDTIAGSVTTTLSSPTTLTTGKTTVTTAGTRVQFTTNTSVSVVVKALSTNTGIIYVGNSTVASTNGFQIKANEAVALDITNTNAIYIDSSVNGEGVSWLATN